MYPFTKGKIVFKLVPPLLILATIIQAQTRVAAPAGPGTSRDRGIAFLNLESFATIVRNVVNAPVQSVPAQEHSETKPPDERQQYVALYKALTKLQATRASYIEALKLYITGVHQELPLSERHTALVDQVKALQMNLDALSAAFDPLKLSLDYHAPEVSALIYDYQLGKQRKRVSRGIFDTLTYPELVDLQTHAIANGRTLDEAIKALLRSITMKYPDIDKSA